MTNELHRVGLRSNWSRRDSSGVKQKENLATHAKQLTKYLETCSTSESDERKNYHSTTLPGVKIPFVVIPEPAPRRTMRNSIRKLPRRSNSIKDKKKGDERENLKEKGKVVEKEKAKMNDGKPSFNPPDAEKKTAGQMHASKEVKDSGPKSVTVACGMVTEPDRAIMTSLDPSELMLVSADKGDLGTLQVLLKKSSEKLPSLCVVKDSKGETPLHKAAKGGYLKCLKFLAEKVPNHVSCLDKSGMTPAAHSAKNGHVNCLKWLVEESSAYVELAVRDGQTHLLHYAASEGMEQCLSYLLGFMAKRKITTDIIDAQGQTPLHTAAKMGHLSCVQTLVEHGADVLAKDHEGLTSASVAHVQKQPICSRYLLMAESCWILASRVSTLFRDVNGLKKENKELKKTVESLRAKKKSDLPNRPETVGGRVDETGKQIDESPRKISFGLRERNFPDGESPKSTFTEADKGRPQIVSPKNHVINRDSEINNVQHLKVVRQGSNTSDNVPLATTSGIAEISPAEKIKAKEIAMVTHQLMSTRHLQLIRDKKTKETKSPEDVKPTQTSVDDTAVVIRRSSSTRNKNTRPKSLSDKDLRFMRSVSDLGFNYKPKSGVLERRASCTEIAKQSNLETSFSVSQSEQRLSKENSDSDLSPTDSKGSGVKESFWDKVGARKLLSRKKNVKARPLSGGLSDLQTASTDKILELYARESRGSSTRLNNLIKEEDETSPLMGRRTMSSLELKSHASSRDSRANASFSESRSKIAPSTNLRSSERKTSSQSKSPDQPSREKVTEGKKVRPVAKPRLKLRTASENDVSLAKKETVKTNESAQRTVRNETPAGYDGKEYERAVSLESYGYTWDKMRESGDVEGLQENLECTDV